MKQNPFTIPEIFHILNQFLDQKDRVKCITVCKVWYNILLPFIWKKIDFKKNFQVLKDPANLEKHAYLVRDIRIYSESPLFAHKVLYPCLQKLFLYGSLSKNIFPANILYNNPTIQQLNIDYNTVFPMNFNLWETISHYPNLRNISLSYGHSPITSRDALAFWTTISRLKELRLLDTNLPMYLFTHPLTPQTLQNMTHLCLHQENPQLPFEFFIRATKLETVDTYLHPQRGDQLTRCFQQNTWHNLHSIRILGEITETQIRQMLNSITRLTALDFNQPSWGIESFQALSRHFGTLEKLSQRADSFTSEMINNVLCSCPNLLMIQGEIVDGSYIVNNVRIINNGQPCDGWICTRMTHMRLIFHLEDIDSQIPVLTNQARLTELVYLDMVSFEEQDQDQDQGLSLSLEYGLEMLRPLNKLRYIAVSNLNQALTKADIKWMAENWKRPKNINGRLHFNGNISLGLRDYLEEEYGIESDIFI